MKYTAAELADILRGTVDGDPQASVSSFAKIEHGRQGNLCFYANPKYERYVYESNASVILVNKDFVPSGPVSATLVRVDNAYDALADLLQHVSASRRKYSRRRSLRSRIACNAKLGSKVWVGDYVTIGRKASVGSRTKIYDHVSIGDGVVIGEQCIIYPGTVIFPGTTVGDRTILHAGCIIGDDGFGNALQPDGTWKKIEHIGGVKIGSDVEIGSNTTVDRAPMEFTVIGDGVRIDNLCVIAHNVQIGDNTVIAAQTGIAGSTAIGKNCILAGQVGVVGHVKIADGTTVGAQAGVIGNVRKSGAVLFGTPAIDKDTYIKAYARFKAAASE